jgi:hypothetical protein
MIGDFVTLLEETLEESLAFARKSVANEIQTQLGKSLFMFGAKNLVSGESDSGIIGYDKPHRGYLTFDVAKPRGAKITILLNKTDMYDVVMGKADRSYNWKVLKTAENIGVDNLIPTIEKFTGMRGSLR